MKENSKEELMVELVNALGKASGLDELKMELSIILNDYDIKKRSREIIVYENDGTAEMIKKFMAVKLASGRTEETVKFYGKTLSSIFEKLNKPYDKVTTDDIRVYMAIRVQRDKVSKSTANNERRSLSSFYGWLQGEELLSVNPMAKVEPIKEPKKKKTAFSTYELELIRDACQTTKERCLVEVLISTWCRVSEVAQIRIDEINGDHIIVHGKGEKDREVFLNAKAQLMIKNYLAERSDDNPYLFPMAKCADDMSLFVKGRTKEEQKNWHKDPTLVDETDHTKTATIESIIRRIGKKAGVMEAHPHRFRRTGATMALRAGMDLMLVSKILGHESIATTQIYLDISSDELMEAHKKYAA